MTSLCTLPPLVNADKRELRVRPSEARPDFIAELWDGGQTNRCFARGNTKQSAIANLETLLQKQDRENERKQLCPTMKLS